MNKTKPIKREKRKAGENHKAGTPAAQRAAAYSC